MPDPGVRESQQPVEEERTEVIEGTPDRALWDRLKGAKGKPINIYDDSEGRVRSFVARPTSGAVIDPSILHPGRSISLDMRPTPIPPDQLLKAYDEAGEFLSAIEKDHPVLSNAFANNPNMLHLLPEISMMLGGPSGLGIDVAGSLLDAMPDAIDYRSYAESMFQTQVQQMFWQDVASQFDSDAKDVVSYLFSGLEERGADRVASLAFAWLKDHPMQTPDDQDQLLLKLNNWAYTEQQGEAHDSGIFGKLDWLQEKAENLVEIPVNGLIGWLGSPEEAIRRSGLTLGQQAAYQMGLDPDDTAWSIASGVTDALGEILLDPLNLVAGVGAGVKAAKSIPLGLKAIEKGRAVFALKSALPILGRSISPLKTRSLTARATYAFKAKTVDHLFDTFGASRAGQEAFTLLKEGNKARFLRRFPQLERLPDSFYDAAKLTNSPEDVGELMKHIHWADNMVDPDEINKAKKALDDAQGSLDRAVKPAPQAKAALELDVLKAQMKVDMMAAKPSKIFVVSELPAKPNRSLYNFVSTRTAGREGHIANLGRRWTADLTQGVPNEINLFNSRRSLGQVGQLLEHYGVEQSKADDLLNEFLALDIGERQEFMFHKVVPAIGDATKNPLLRFTLYEFFNRADGVRAFAKDLDEVVDDAGKVTRLPIIPSNMQQAFPFPVREVDQIIRRYGAAGKLAGALTLGGRRGLTSGTRSNRAQLLTRLRNLVGDKLPEDIADEDLYAMAYSWLGQGVDPRGWVSKLASGGNSKILKPLDMAFRKAMLGLRPVQWLFKVVLMEEPLRAHVYDMPNMYTKPLGWTQEIMSNHYLSAAEKAATKQVEWVDSIRTSTLAGKKTVDEALDAIRETYGKAADQIIGDRTFKSVKDVDRRLASWTHKAALDKQQAKLLPNSNLTRRWRAWKVNKASDVKAAELLGPNFRPKDDIEDIMHKNISTLFGDGLATTQAGVKPFNWDITMSNRSRIKYGQAWGSKVVNLTEDAATKWALKRMIAKAAGEEVPAGLKAEAFMETSTWGMMKGNIRRFFPDEVDDAARIERYFDEKVESWAEYVLKPVLSQANVNRADFLTELVERRNFKVPDINGHAYDISLKSAGTARRKLAQIVEDQGTFAHTTPFPDEIAAVPFDFRFMDGSEDHNFFRRFIDWNIQTFGEKATQQLNRRPFWRAQRRKWLKIYQDMGMPDGLAAELASTKASQMTNYVMYDISEAPTVVKKLNNVIPFFGATYEVLGTWAYKLPAATGGYWAMGVPAFGRKIDRLMRSFVNTGIAQVVEQDGEKRYELQLWREPDTGTPLGDALSKIGYHLRRTPENVIAHLLAAGGLFGFTPENVEDKLSLSRAGYGFSLGNPLNPRDFGLLSFAQFNAGLSPATNWITNKAMGVFAPAADVQRVESGDSDTTLADLADKLEVDPDDLARANRGLLDAADYKGIFSDDVDPADITIKAGSLVTIPGSSLFETLVEDTFYPFGEVETGSGILRGLVPGMYQHIMRGLGLAGTPSDGAWMDDSGELDSIPFFSTPMDKAAVNSQILEAFYYLESTEGVFTEQVFPLQEKYQKLVAAGGGERADAIAEEIRMLTNDVVKRATDIAGGSLILRGLGGGFFPNTGRMLRSEIAEIDAYWDSREAAEQLRGNDAEGKPLISVPLSRKKKVEDLDNFFIQISNWLGDDTGDDARTFVKQNNPEIFAYLQPKTFWGAAGEPPAISSYDDYLTQIKSGERKPVPLAVAIQRHLHSGIETDYWIDYVNTFGNNPEEATSIALDNIALYDELQDKRFSGHDALYMSDDLHGGEYLKWLEERGSHEDDSFESVEAAQDRHREYMDTLGELLDMELDPYMEPAEIRDFRTSIKTTIAKLRDLSEEQEFDPAGKNPYELAWRTYWDELYGGMNDAMDEVWDAIGESTDTEETSLLFENLKMKMNEWSGKRFSLFGTTDITYPSPLDVRWNRKNEDEKRAFALKRATLPMEWLNLDDVQRIMEFAPPDAGTFFPQTQDQMQVYTAWTIKKNEIDEMAEKGVITESERREAQSSAEAAVKSHLLEEGRQDELTYMDLWPIEKLHVLGLLPHELEEVIPQVRFIKESLAAEDRGPRSQIGDALLLPLYNSLMNKASNDSQYGNMLRDLGLTLFDESAYDAMLPRLIVGDFSDA